jgi:hypothetical protein
MKFFIRAMRYGKWSCGFEQWEGKPQFDFAYFYYDGHHYCLHIWKFWVEIEY